MKRAIRVIDKKIKCPLTGKEDYVFACEHMSDVGLMTCQSFNKLVFIFNQLTVICNVPLEDIEGFDYTTTVSTGEIKEIK